MRGSSQKEGFSGPTEVLEEIRSAAAKTFPGESGFYSRWIICACVEKLYRDGHKLPPELPIGKIIEQAMSAGVDVAALLLKEIKRKRP